MFFVSNNKINSTWNAKIKNRFKEILQKEKELVKPGDEKGVEFGSSKKRASGVTTRAKGTDALRIPLNVGGGAGGGGTGVNP